MRTLLAIFFSLWFTLTWALNVETSLPPGIYDHPITLELFTSDSEAKIFYTFKPTKGPGDGYIYTGTLRLTRTTPLYYFAFTDPTNETKILSGTYTFVYSNALRFQDKNIEIPAGNTQATIRIYNTGNSGVDLDGWYISGLAGRSPLYGSIGGGESKNFAIGLTLNDTELALRSPDDSEKALLPVLFTAPPKPPVVRPTSVTPPSPAEVIESGNSPPIEENTAPSTSPEITPEIGENSSPESAIPATNPVASASQIDIVPAEDPIILDNLKSSVIQSSSQLNIGLLALLGLLILAGILGYMRRKNLTSVKNR